METAGRRLSLAVIWLDLSASSTDLRPAGRRGGVEGSARRIATSGSDGPRRSGISAPGKQSAGPPTRRRSRSGRCRCAERSSSSPSAAASRLQESVDTAATPEASSPAASPGLTQREAQVLALVAEGRTNRQIGQELFITPKTASVHVSRILAKLGVAGRGEAAAIAHRLGLDKR